MRLNDEAQEEIRYMKKHKKSDFITYKCPYEPNICYLYGKGSEERYKNKNTCLECKSMLFDKL